MEEWLLAYWDIVVGVLVVVIWLNRTTARLEQRVITLEQKMMSIWERYNSLIDKLLSEKKGR